MTYRYPDLYDQITLTIIESEKVGTEFLIQAENRILSSAEEIFQENSFDSLLDLGCGSGRLIIKFSKYFNRIIALDPDQRRIDNARKRIAANNVQNVCYIQALFNAERFQDDSFDVVLCNQIIQHIDTRIIEPMIQGIFKILKPNGIVVLTTSHSSRNDDIFSKSYLKQGEIINQEISEIEFNSLTVNDQGILPIHYFSRQSLKKYLYQFTEIELSVYDDLYPHPMLDTLIFIGEKP